jgi:aspartyl aminopeptidase
MAPILGTQTVLEKSAEDALSGGSDDPWRSGHEPLLLKLLVDKLALDDVEQIADFELNLFDTQPASIGGINKEFLNSARLDNLATVFVSIEALIAFSTSDALAEDNDISLVALFDHEEVGSRTLIPLSYNAVFVNFILLHAQISLLFCSFVWLCQC